LHPAFDRQCQRLGNPVAGGIPGDLDRRRFQEQPIRQGGGGRPSPGAPLRRLAFRARRADVHAGYLFRTSPSWALWARGSPNSAKGKLVPLDGVVETDWLDFPFTMNWRFTRPGTVRFEAGEPFCFITPVPHLLLDRVQPQIRPLEDEPALKAAYEARSKSRSDFNSRLAARDPNAVAQGRQRHYVRGEDASCRVSESHLSKRKLKPVVKR
jgi:hypothetical protein